MEAASEIKTIEVDQRTLGILKTTGKWTMFLSIIGFIFIGIMFVIGVMTGTFLSVFYSANKGSEVSEYLILAIFFMLAVIFLFPVIFLFRFSKHAAKTVQKSDNQELYKAIKNLKLYFGYIGVLIIISLMLYVIVLIIAGQSLPYIK